MKQFLESLVKSIVENPDAVIITEETDSSGRQLLTIAVDPQDMGRVIGKSGKVINAIRTIMRVVAIRQGVKIRVDIQDDQAGETSEAAPEAAEETSEAAEETSEATEETSKAAPEAVESSTEEVVAEESTEEAKASDDDSETTAADLVSGPADEEAKK